MEASNDIMIRISPNEGKITVEEDAQGVFSRKRGDRAYRRPTHRRTAWGARERSVLPSRFDRAR